ncbi:hypothetical protein BB560_003127 [Smittium megazygosporum]|uniref:Protein kinase domain-containing protein n=1 Tax=Smittium megazygosporum TaxID=133381 RepID=A0A2T9ZCU7_9FUNG|nr:hypothetical protein BB560_003127 [Smittium megazygosporum]
MSGIGSFLYSSITNIVSRSKIPNFPYNIEENPVNNNSLWSIHNGTKNDNQLPVSIFIFRKENNRHLLEFVENSIKRAKTLRHPDLVQYIDSSETNDAIYVATERVSCLDLNKPDYLEINSVVWGIYKVTRGIKFLNNECKLVHGNIQASSIFITQSLEWKLFGFELTDSPDSYPPKYTKIANLGAGYSDIIPPELRSSNIDSIKSLNIGVIDSYQFGHFLSILFEKGLFEQSSQIQKFLKLAIPKISNTNPSSRFPISRFITEAAKPNSLFSLPFVKSMKFIEEIPAHESDQVREFLVDAGERSQEYPVEMFKFKILPEILQRMKFGGEYSVLVSTVVKIKEAIGQEEFESIVVPAIVDSFLSNDRQLRFNLLKNLGKLVNAIPEEILTNKIFPNYANSVPVIREETAKSCVFFVPRLPEKIINSDLVRSICRLFSDQEPGIRANSLICIGMLHKHLTKSTMKQIVGPALINSLRDPFPPSRVASLKAIKVSSSLIDPNDAARKIIPILSILLIDSEKQVRETSKSALLSLLSLVDEYGKTLPETAVKRVENKEVQSSASGTSTPNQSSISLPGGWVMSSLATGVSKVSGVISYSSENKDLTKSNNPEADTVLEPSENSTIEVSKEPLNINKDSSAFKYTQPAVSNALNKPLDLYKSKPSEDKFGWGFDNADFSPKKQSFESSIKTVSDELEDLSLKSNKKNTLGLKQAKNKINMASPKTDPWNNPFSNESQSVSKDFKNETNSLEDNDWGDNDFDDWNQDPSSWNLSASSKTDTKVLTSSTLGSSSLRGNSKALPKNVASRQAKPKNKLGAIKLN